MAEWRPIGRTRTIAGRTVAAVATALTAGWPRVVFVLGSVGYLLVYLVMIGHLRPGLGGIGLTVVPDPLGTILDPALGPFSFRAIARVRLGSLTLLLGLDTVVGLALATLVGTNLAVSTLVWTRPAACGITDRTAGALAGLPALVSGSACCGPLVAVVLGIQLSSSLLTAIQWLVPFAAVLLIGTLVWVGGRIAPRGS